MPTLSEKRVLEYLAMKGEDGATTEEIARECDLRGYRAHNVLVEVYGIYVDRWVMGPSGKYEAVWCLAEVPDHCPVPEVVSDGKVKAKRADVDRVFDADSFAAICVDRRVHRFSVDERGVAY